MQTNTSLTHAPNRKTKVTFFRGCENMSMAPVPKTGNTARFVYGRDLGHLSVYRDS